MTADILALRHVAFEDLGLFAPILKARGHNICTVEAPDGGLESLDPLAPDLLVILGGPIGAYEETTFPFLADELRLIERRLVADRPILGICLGAQLMARVLGARVYPGPVKEIGWAPISLTKEAKGHPVSHLGEEDAMVLHWHGDSFDLPDGAQRLASNETYENQAFAYGHNALALQFHGEAAGNALERWFVGHTLEISATDGVSVEKLRADTQRYSDAMITRGSRFFTAFLEQMGL